MGVSLRFLQQLLALFELLAPQDGQSPLQGKSTRQVAEDLIKPATKSSRCAYVDLPTVSGPDLVGQATVFVSHVWDYNFVKMVELLQQWWNKNGQDPHCYFFIDIFSHNQHEHVASSAERFVFPVADTLRTIGHAITLLIDWRQIAFIRRSWCLYEMFVANASNMSWELVWSEAEQADFGNSLAAELEIPSDLLFSRLFALDLDLAQATDPADQSGILAAVKMLGGVDTLRACCCEILFGEFLKTAADNIDRRDQHDRTTLDLQAKYAGVVGQLGNHVAAAQLFSQLLPKQEFVYGPNSISVAETLQSIGVSLLKQARDDEAIKILKRAMKIFETVHGPKYQQIAVIWTQLSEGYRGKGDIKMVETCCRRALKIDEETLPSDSLDLALSLNNLAVSLDDQGKFQESRPLHERSLAIRKAKLGNDDPMVANCLNNLGTLLVHTGNSKDGIEMLEQAHTIFLRHFGPSHPHTQKSAASIAILRDYMSTRS